MDIYGDIYELAETISSDLGRPIILAEQAEISGGEKVIAPEMWDSFEQSPDFFGIRHIIAFNQNDAQALTNMSGQYDVEFAGAVIFYKPII